MSSPPGRPRYFTDLSASDELVFVSLMWALLMIVSHELLDNVAKMPLVEWNDAIDGRRPAPHGRPLMDCAPTVLYPGEIDVVEKVERLRVLDGGLTMAELKAAIISTSLTTFIDVLWTCLTN